jgi:glycosyltransferase involved in cell wall biosynthesis
MNSAQSATSNPQPRLTVDGDVAIFLSQGAGHRLWYVRLLCDELTLQGRIVDVFLPLTGQIDDAVATHLSPILGPTVRLSNIQQPVRRQLSSLLARYSEVILPDGDKQFASVTGQAVWHRLRHLWAPRRTPPIIRLLLMRFTAGSDLRSHTAYAVKLALARLAASHLPRLKVYALTMNTGDEYVSSRSVRWIQDVHAFDPSPAIDRDSARRELGLQLNDQLVGIVGAITARKCYRQAVECLVHCPLEVHLLVAGKLDDEARHFFENRFGARIVVRDGYIEDRELDQYILASDAVLALYTNTGSSGIALKALAAGTPMIAHGNSVVESHVQKSSAGVVVEDLSPRSLASGIRSALLLGRQNLAVVNGRRDFARAFLYGL